MSDKPPQVNAESLTTQLYTYRRDAESAPVNLQDYVTDNDVAQMLNEIYWLRKEVNDAANRAFDAGRRSADNGFAWLSG